jgi:hypothetical protein
MMNLVKKTVVAGLIGLSALAVLPATASADGFSFEFGVGNGGPRMHHWGPGPDGPGFGRPRRGCDEWQAVETARDYGLRHARVVRADPRKVVVEGRGRGGWGRIVFANVRGCPVIAR